MFDLPKTIVFEWVAHPGWLVVGPSPHALALMLALIPLGAAAQLGANAAADQDYLERVVNRVLESERSNMPIAWSHGETGSTGTVTVERTFYLERTPCRDYAWTLDQADGTEVSGRGTGCRSGAGTWELDEDPPVVARRPASGAAEPAATAKPECACPEPAPRVAEAPPAEPPFADYTLPAKAGF